MENQPAAPVQPKLSIFNDQVWAGSLDVATHFEKRHNDVLRSIRNLEIPEEFGLRNFAQSSYFNEQGKEQPAYDMTRDGFVFLVMGFTGPKAALFKIAYLQEFNRMEAQLRSQGQDGGVSQQRYIELLEEVRELRRFQTESLKVQLAETARRCYRPVTQELRDKVAEPSCPRHQTGSYR